MDSPRPDLARSFNILVAGGTLIGLDGSPGHPVRDVAIRDGVVAEVAPWIDPARASTVLAAHGSVVTAGWIDMHSHVFPEATVIGAPADQLCLASGVTTTVDAGSCGSANFGAFARLAVAPSVTRVLCFVNLSRIGMSGPDGSEELLTGGNADPAGTSEVICASPQVAVGLKLRASHSVVGERCLPLLRTAIAVGQETSTPVHLHIGDSSASLDDILALLRPGDMVTHMQTPKREGLLDEKGKVRASVREARARGVLFDCGHGRTHFSFDVAARLLDQGFPPDTISTDMSATSYAQLAPGLATVVNKWLALGLTPQELIPAVTSAPAAAVGRAQACGRLEVGGPADLAVFSVQDGDYQYADATGATVRARQRLVTRATIRAGRVAWRCDEEHER